LVEDLKEINAERDQENEKIRVEKEELLADMEGLKTEI